MLNRSKISGPNTHIIGELYDKLYEKSSNYGSHFCSGNQINQLPALILLIGNGAFALWLLKHIAETRAKAQSEKRKSWSCRWTKSHLLASAWDVCIWGRVTQPMTPIMQEVSDRIFALVFARFLAKGVWQGYLERVADQVSNKSSWQSFFSPIFEHRQWECQLL